jgi:hypothetical protein
MDSDRAREPADRPPSTPLGEAVPSRAALTELARGFLILNDRDTGRAARFALSFLREHTGAELESLVSHRPRLPSARRPVLGGVPWWADSVER